MEHRVCSVCSVQTYMPVGLGVCEGECALLQILIACCESFFSCRSCADGNWKVLLCHSVPCYLATSSKMLYMYSAHNPHTLMNTQTQKHTHTAQPVHYPLSASCSTAGLHLQWRSFPILLDTNCLQCFFIICLHHWTLFFSTHADSLAARVLRSPLIYRVWNYLQKSFLLWNFRVKLCATIVAHKIDEFLVLSSDPVWVQWTLPTKLRNLLDWSPKTLYHHYIYLVSYSCIYVISYSRSTWGSGPTHRGPFEAPAYLPIAACELFNLSSPAWVFHLKKLSTSIILNNKDTPLTGLRRHWKEQFNVAPEPAGAAFPAVVWQKVL